jgi:hypothetical protein
MRFPLAAIALAAFTVSVPSAGAHDFIDITGKVTNYEAGYLSILTEDLTAATMQLTEDTKVVRDGREVGLRAIETGQRVTITGFGHDPSDMLVDFVTILPVV